MSELTPTRTAVLALAAARASRFITTDKLGDWLIVRPVKAWAIRHEGEGVEVVEYVTDARGEEIPAKFERTGEPDEDNGWRSKLAAGTECPFCAGFWAGALILTTDTLLPDHGPTRTAFTLGTRALALNYIVGHVSSRLDA